MTEHTPKWMSGTKRSDWLCDGHPMRGKWGAERWNDLDWNKAWVDAGPSPTGNLGPYWHVPLRSGETVHRLYPKFLLGPWAPVVRQAIKSLTERRGR